MKHVINVPNSLTLARIVLTPVIVFMILERKIPHALMLMAIAAITDMLDGLIARYWNMHTRVGAYLDPLADKIMLLSTVVTLFVIDHVPLYLFLAIIFRDITIIVGALAYEMITHNLRMEPSLVSKATTLFQCVYVLMVLLSMMMPVHAAWLQWAAWLTFAVTCASGLHYLVVWTFKALSSEQQGHG